MSTFGLSDFEAQMQSILGEEEWPLLAEALQNPAPVSIRYNPFKKVPVVAALAPVPWSNGGYYLPQRPSFTLDPTFHAGAYYVQEASSMFIGRIVQQLLSTKEGIRALDLCAAPGGKSTDLLSNLPEGSLLIANEVIRSRYNILHQNMIKWGQSNVVCTNHDSRDFNQLAGFFDLILVDAPCSGEGLFRKDHKAREEWSVNNVQLCTGRQKRILADAVQMLAPGGYLLYSTCTYNRSENEENAKWLISEFGLTPQHLSLDKNWNIETREVGYQFYPHRLKGEGFYSAVLQKKDGPTYQYPKKLVALKKQLNLHSNN
jgi:16S rRNA C967 or C1407 C5-methylase (RsmB/RsmF family)